MSEELKIIDNIRKQGFRPQVVGCFIYNSKILFLYKKEHNLWQFPQGGIENEETIQQALKREMTEELGKDFINNCDLSNPLIFNEQQLKFPSSSKGFRELKTDLEEKIKMKGKRYFFIKIPTNKTKIKINQTEFDDYQWLTFAEASSKAKEIYQKGKRQLTLKAIESLKNS